MIPSGAMKWFQYFDHPFQTFQAHLPNPNIIRRPPMGVMGPRKETEKPIFDLKANTKMDPEKQTTEAINTRKTPLGIASFSKEPIIKTMPVNCK